MIWLYKDGLWSFERLGRLPGSEGLSLANLEVHYLINCVWLEVGFLDYV